LMYVIVVDPFHGLGKLVKASFIITILQDYEKSDHLSDTQQELNGRDSRLSSVL